MSKRARNQSPPGGDDAIRSLPDFDGLWSPEIPPGQRLEGLRQAAQAVRARLLTAAPVAYYRSIELVRAPYPTRYGLRDALALPVPYMHIVNRLFVIQTETAAGLRTIVVSPSDADGNAETPFFRRLRDSLGPLRETGSRMIAPQKHTVAQALAVAGVRPEDVDYITYDHLHTQDLRAWLGDGERAGLFPRARLLVMRDEWNTACDPSPPQRDWYCPEGTRGVPEDRVVLLDDSVTIGDNVALVRTPGHTEGNHSIVARTAEGLMVTSENGVGPDAYAPEHSRIPGLRRFARETGMEVVLNGNTLERGLEQYASMVVEKELAGPSLRDPRFPNMVCSSEFDQAWFAPGLKPTFGFGDLCFGQPVTPGAGP